MSSIKDKEFISVVMPVYNGEKYLRPAIESILSQTYSHFELIIVIDGSTDSSESIVLSFKDPRIVCLKNQTNNGLISSLNRGLRQAKGTLVARMDADDIAMPDRFKEQVKAFVSDEGIVAVGTDFFHLDGKKLSLVKTQCDNDYLKGVLLFATCFGHPTVMMRNPIHMGNVYYEPQFKHAEDYRIWTRLATRGSFFNINRPLLKYRVHSSQISAANKQDQLLVSSVIRRDYMTWLGFKFNEDQLAIHNIIGNNELISSMEQLKGISGWLHYLLEQNTELKIFNPRSFNRVIYKMWLDSCGNTSLGFRAFRFFFKSSLSGIIKPDTNPSPMLLAKCVWRWIRH